MRDKISLPPQLAVWIASMLVAIGLSAAAGATRAAAESPPAPPARFTGTVLVNGVPPPAGTTVEARIGTTTCGVTTTFVVGSETRYRVDSPALDPGATPNCGTEGATVEFYVAGQKAVETGSWRNYDLNILNLTVTSAETPTASPGPALTPTPGPPPLGNAGLAEPPRASWLAAVVGLFVMGIGAGTLTLLRRRS